MKKLLLIVTTGLLLTSCCTIFTSSRQSITFSGESGVKIYDAATNIKLGEISNDGITSIQLKKSLQGKNIIAKKDGYKPSPMLLESSINPIFWINLLFWPGFIVDLASQTANKWDNTLINVEMTETAENK